MKRILSILILVIFSISAKSQLNNSWIDYNKTYYKFSVSKDGLYRIPSAVLSTIGLGNTPANNFQLWRNGKQVRLYTSTQSGPLSTNDYIEFIGKKNDGVPDKNLYIKPGYQLCDSFSLFNDTATYFLTVNNDPTENLRFVNVNNNLTGNTLPAETYFMRTVSSPYKSIINGGYAVKIGEYVYSSSYEMGEGWTSDNIAPGDGYELYKEFNGLNVYTEGPANSVSFYVSAFGNAVNIRNFIVKFFNNTVLNVPMNFFDTVKTTVSNLPLTLFQNPNFLQVSMTGNSATPTDRVVVANLQITYPARFNFNGDRNFYFSLKGNGAAKYLEIENFNYGTVAPVLYSMNDGARYTGVISADGKVRFLLPPFSDVKRDFMLTSQEATNIQTVNSLQVKNFINFSLPANQGDYIIISNPALYNDGSGNNYVEQYRQYRSSLVGGGYNAKIISIDELTDQFGFGIQKHPASIRDFVRFSRIAFSANMKYVFIIGRGVNAFEARNNEGNPVLNKIDMVPTFGWPASDILLMCEPGTNVPLVPVGRLAAIVPGEIKSYLDKVKEYEIAQADPQQTISSKAWMKNIIHVIGGSDSIENAQFLNYMNDYKQIVEDSLMGAKVETFVKASASAVEQANGIRIEQLINEGVSEIGYFGHSSANILAFNLSSPETYTNAGKYPFINISGCSAGNFFTYDPARIANNLCISEKYVLAQQRGSIAFLASTHLGIPPFLNFYNTELYNNYSRRMYGKTLGEIIKRGIETLAINPNNLSFYQRIHLEEINLHGDPAIKINSFSAPDYTVEDQTVKISPTTISVADNSFDCRITVMNIGKAINDSIRIRVTRKLPNDSLQVLLNSRIKATLYSDTFRLVVPINPITDKGRNLLTVTIDADNNISELSELNNTVVKEFFIFEDEIRPVMPYNFSIVNQSPILFRASTANPLVSQRQYVMELDTTELFNSPFKKQYNTSGNGGLIEFLPNNVVYKDSTVYYWRTSMVPLSGNQVIWNSFSFIYLSQSSPGFNQSHYFQHTKSTYSSTIKLDNDRVFRYNDLNRNLYIRTGLFPTTDYDRIDVVLDYNQLELYGCKYNSLQFLVYDTFTMQPWKNFNISPTSGRYGSWPICSDPTRNSFEFPYTDAAYRKKAMDFIDSIPDGMYVSITNLGNANTNQSFISEWQADQATLGTGNSLYHKLKSIGFDKIDSFSRNLPFVYFFRKNMSSFQRQQFMGGSAEDQINANVSIRLKNNNGVIESPVFGPARAWTSLHWKGVSVDPLPTDEVKIEVIGVKSNGTEQVLATVVPARDTSLSFVDARIYPSIKLRMKNNDLTFATPNQLNYWRINADLMPEGVIAPNILFTLKDSVSEGETIDLQIAFKNISTVPFDSVKVKLAITDQNNVVHLLPVPRQKELQPNDTISLKYSIPTRDYTGLNSLSVFFNPEYDQPEQYLYNNFLYKDFFVTPDKVSPLLDVTFDGIHILNNDIVASKPNILIKLNDENKHLALSDTSYIKLMLRFPDGTLRNYFFNDTMRFTPANLASGENNAYIEFNPYLSEDGDYELIVTGRDVVGNKAGSIEYKVSFTVLNTPMISNLLNYPNPFTTSTAFVFTLTGREVPQNMRIQILTITGKIVREITKSELGDLHIGRNITSFKWDGTDSYGQPLGNGVYLYRVITNHQGKSLGKYKGYEESTDKYFKEGYGKMYLMR